MTQDTNRPGQTAWPRIRTVGVDGLLVSFGDSLSEPANRACLAFRHAVEHAQIAGIEETSTSLVSSFIRFDLAHFSHDQMRAALAPILEGTDWFHADLPEGRKLWHVPTVYGTDLAPQLGEAAELAGLSEVEAITSISTTRVRVNTIGFMPGLPYLGELEPAWDIPRQSQLTEKVPAGALTVAIRQMVLFSVPAPTGWRHIGQTALRLFRPDSETPFMLRPGDEVLFEAVARDSFDALKASGPDGGATFEVLS